MKMFALAITIASCSLAVRHAEAKGCTEHSDVVGLQHCSHFGTWSRDDDMPRLWFDLVFALHEYRFDHLSLAPGVFAAMEPGTVPTEGNGLVLRGLGGLGHVFYVGFEMTIGNASVQPTPDPPPSSTFYVAPNLIAGVHHDLLRIGWSAELAAGYRHENFEYCPTTGCMAIDADRDGVVLEARIGADLYLTSHWSIGLRAGKSLLEDNDTSFMVFTSAHIRAMDGM